MFYCRIKREKGACEPGAIIFSNLLEDHFQPARKGLSANDLSTMKTTTQITEREVYSQIVRHGHKCTFPFYIPRNAKHCQAQLMLLGQKTQNGSHRVCKFNKTATHCEVRFRDSHVSDTRIRQTPTFSKRDHNQGSVHEDGVGQVLRNSHRFRFMELYKTDT